jgi:hypothetical protein
VAFKHKDRQFAIESIKGSSDLHLCDATLQTPLVLVMRPAQYPYDFGTPQCDVCVARGAQRSSVVEVKFCETCLEAAVAHWLHILEDAGVDIYEYGRRKVQLFRSHKQREWIDIDLYSPPERASLPISFEFVSANNICLYWEEFTDRYAGEFWRLVDGSDLEMPGG